MTTYYTLKKRRDTAANWTSFNPVLALGEEGYETDTGMEKRGDGATAWTLLPYIPSGMTVLNARDYGAAGDGGTTDNAPKIQAAIDALPTNGGTVFIPPSASAYVCNTGFTARGRSGIRLVGGTTRTAGATTGTQLAFSMTDTSSAVNASGAIGFTLENIGISYTSNSYTGRLVDMRAGAFLGTVKNVLISASGQATQAAHAGIATDGSHTILVEGCMIQGCDVGLYGRDLADSNSASNSVTVVATEFKSNTTAHTKNPGDNWAFTGCTFEPVTSGAPAAMAADATAATGAATTFMGCWFGDVTQPGTQITIRSLALTLIGNLFGFGGGSTAGTFLAVSALANSSTFGLVCLNNDFIGIAGGGQTSNAFSINVNVSNRSVLRMGNSYVNVATRMVGGETANTLDLDNGGTGIWSPTLRGTITIPSGSKFSTPNAATGGTTGFTAGSGTAMNSASTSTGGNGSTAYTFGDIVLALKNLGLIQG